MPYTTAAADAYIEQTRNSLNPRRRLGFHVMGEVGWINDPNGFCFYQGQYHLFYQHFPYGVQWGPMHWGHVTSPDLIAWTYQPIALAPDHEYDKSGCFSGSAIEKDGELYLIYTGHIDEGGLVRQVQNIASSTDGIHFTKYEANPVLDSSDLPEGALPEDFRDPKVLRYAGAYYMAVGSRNVDESGQVLLYTSADLMNWTYAGTIAQSQNQIGKMWECPDLFSVDGTDVLILSPQSLPAEGYRHQNLHSSTYMLGRMDFAASRFAIEQMDDLDGGFDFYAPQTMEAPDGRRIIIGWMAMWESQMPTQQDGWAGQLTIPRVLHVEAGQLRTYPVQELAQYRQDEVAWGGIVTGDLVLESVRGTQLDLELTIEPGEAVVSGIHLLKGEVEETVIGYDAVEGVLYFDRGRSGEGPGGVRKVPVRLKEGHLDLRILVDRISVEVFVNGGERALTGLVYPEAESDGVALFAVGGGARMQLTKWAIVVGESKQ